MSVFKVVVDTDVLLDHRTGDRSPSVVRMAKFLFYATVFNAIELFSMGRSARESGLMEDALAPMKIPGLHAGGSGSVLVCRS